MDSKHVIFYPEMSVISLLQSILFVCVCVRAHMYMLSKGHLIHLGGSDS